MLHKAWIEYCNIHKNSKRPPWSSAILEKYDDNISQPCFRVLNLIFVKRLIQRIHLNHYMRFNLNDLKVLEHLNHAERTWKGGF